MTTDLTAIRAKAMRFVGTPATPPWWPARMVKICDEVERLREALNRVVAIHDHSMHDADTNADDMARCARAALAQKGGE